MKRMSAKTRWMLMAVVAAGGLVACGAGWWWMRAQGYDVREGIEWVLAQVRALGPVAFFSLMALLPAVGAPVSVFTLTAGPVFGPTLGLPLVLRDLAMKHQGLILMTGPTGSGKTLLAETLARLRRRAVERILDARPAAASRCACRSGRSSRLEW